MIKIAICDDQNSSVDTLAEKISKLEFSRGMITPQFFVK